MNKIGQYYINHHVVNADSNNVLLSFFQNEHCIIPYFTSEILWFIGINLLFQIFLFCNQKNIGTMPILIEF
jgi:hypothetical protein